MGDLARHATASLGPRGARLTGHGAEYARLLWPIIVSHTKWPHRPSGPTWATNVTLARETGLDVADVETGLKILRRAGLLATPIGKRPGAARPVGRLLEPALGARCKVLIPEVGHLWSLARSIRTRAASLVTAMVGAYALASDHAGGPIDEWESLGCKMADWRRFVGAKKNASWSKRLGELESLGLIRRDGRRVEVSPPRAWLVLASDIAEQCTTLAPRNLSGGIDRSPAVFSAAKDHHGQTHNHRSPRPEADGRRGPGDSTRRGRAPTGRAAAGVGLAHEDAEPRNDAGDPGRLTENTHGDTHETRHDLPSLRPDERELGGVPVHGARRDGTLPRHVGADHARATDGHRPDAGGSARGDGPPPRPRDWVEVDNLEWLFSPTETVDPTQLLAPTRLSRVDDEGRLAQMSEAFARADYG